MGGRREPGGACWHQPGQAGSASITAASQAGHRAMSLPSQGNDRCWGEQGEGMEGLHRSCKSIHKRGAFYVLKTKCNITRTCKLRQNCAVPSVSSLNPIVLGGGERSPGPQVALSPDSHSPDTAVPSVGTMVSPAQTLAKWPKTRKTGRRQGLARYVHLGMHVHISTPCFIWTDAYAYRNVQRTVVCKHCSWLSREEQLHTAIASYVHPQSVTVEGSKNVHWQRASAHSWVKSANDAVGSNFDEGRLHTNEPI